MKRMKRTRILNLITIIAVLMGLMFCTGFVTAGIAPPKPLSPKGGITDNTPTYKWKPVVSAAKYRFQVIKGGVKVFTKTVNSTVCSPTKCTFTPARTLEYGEHKWRVRAYVGGVWSNYSPKKVFTVIDQPPGFDSQFTSDADGWKQYVGAWTIDSGAYYTVGKDYKAASVGHKGEYFNFTYTARMKRLGCDWCQNGLYIRGTPKPLDAEGYWDTSYLFMFLNDTRVSVQKEEGGSRTLLYTWTYSAAVNPKGWNTLKVVARGKLLKFYINDTLIWKGYDASLTSGLVGILMYRHANIHTDEFWVDWAHLTPIN